MLNEIREKKEMLKSFDVREECGSQENELLMRCRAFPLRYKNHGCKWVKPLAYVFVTLLAVSGVFIAIISKPELMPVVIISAFVLLLIIVIKERQINMMKRLTQYFRDENGEFYRVIFTQGASIPATVSHRHLRHGRHSALSDVEQKARMVDRNLEEAQEAYPAFYYVQRYKQGISDWNAFSGGLAKVAHLENLTLVSRGTKKSIYSCEINGKKTTLKILNAYEGLADEVSR